MMKEITASQLKVERLQTRATTNSDYIDDIAERMVAGDSFPPITVFTDDKDAWLADGIHRLDGAIKAKRKIAVDYRQGTRADAVKFACGANASHGLRRTNDDKRRSVKLALTEFPELSSRAIAELCGVGNHLVEEIRSKNQVGDSPTSHKKHVKTRVGRDGKRQAAKKTTPETTANTEPAAAPKPPVSGAQKSDPRIWDRWEDTFGKLRRLADDLHRNFPHHNHHQEVVKSLNAAYQATKDWRKAGRA